MKLSMISPIAQQIRARYFVTAMALTFAVGPMSGQPSLAGASSQAVEARPQWFLSGVRHLIGLPGVKQRADGRLWATPAGIVFESGGATAFVESANILSLSIGDERILKGGMLGRFARTGIPISGGLGIGLAGVSQAFSVIPSAVGLAASVVTQGSTDIVTIEFLDPHDGYHGAVFTMPRHTAEGLAKNLILAEARSNADAPAQDSCSPVSGHPTAISLLPVVGGDSEIPAEYRALAYEHLFDRLRATNPQLQVYRSGSSSERAGCDAWKLTITVGTFRKGDAVKRALAGPAGLFVGTTSLSYRVAVSDSRGAALLDERMRTVIRGDGESLDLTEALAKAVSRKIRNLQAKGAAAGF